MNLFVFNQSTNRIMISQDFWIYVATWIPLTLFTFLLPTRPALSYQTVKKSVPGLDIAVWCLQGRHGPQDLAHSSRDLG